MIKILSVIGARPQFIKASAFSHLLASHREIEDMLVHTGQHHDLNMSEIFFEELDIPKPKYNLSIQGGGHAEMTGRMLEKIEKVLLAEKPDIVLVYGDTNSTLAGALAAAKLHIPVVHIEAGLRSFNKRMPEEINRILTDQLSDLLFVPSELSASNLRNEGIPSDKIKNCGDIMFDVCSLHKDRADDHKTLMSKFNLANESYLLATIHRQENTDNPKRLRHIMDALIELSQQHQLLLPLHPRTSKQLEDIGYDLPVTDRFKPIAPLGYLDMIGLMRDADLVITDSGGVQKESYFLGTPCVTYRDETEWVELVNSGWNTLVNVELPVAEIVASTQKQISKIGTAIDLYGEGHAAEQILSIIEEFLK